MSWFKNLQLYRLPAPWNVTAAQIEEAITPQSFAPCTSLDMQRTGWIAPRPHGNLVHTVNRQMLLSLQTEKKLLPASVINQFVKKKAAELEEQEGYKPGRKRMKEIKEQMTDELLPRAFSLLSVTRVWIDPVNGWLAIDSGSPGKAEEVMSLLIRAIEKLPAELVRTDMSPSGAMTTWLAEDDAPSGFTIDQDTELQASGESKAVIRLVGESISIDDVTRHIQGGKQCRRLAMTWNDRISFVLTDSLAIRKLKPLDVLQESADRTAQTEEEVFDADMMLMTGELDQMLKDLIEALGGFQGDEQLAA